MMVILSCQYLGDFKLRTAKSELRVLEQLYRTASGNERLGYKRYPLLSRVIDSAEFATAMPRLTNN